MGINCSWFLGLRKRKTDADFLLIWPYTNSVVWRCLQCHSFTHCEWHENAINGVSLTFRAQRALRSRCCNQKNIKASARGYERERYEYERIMRQRAKGPYFMLSPIFYIWSSVIYGLPRGFGKCISGISQGNAASWRERRLSERVCPWRMDFSLSLSPSIPRTGCVGWPRKTNKFSVTKQTGVTFSALWDKKNLRRVHGPLCFCLSSFVVLFKRRET
jgi:hypothetical protein